MTDFTPDHLQIDFCGHKKSETSVKEKYYLGRDLVLWLHHCSQLGTLYPELLVFGHQQYIGLEL